MLPAFVMLVSFHKAWRVALSAAFNLFQFQVAIAVAHWALTTIIYRNRNDHPLTAKLMPDASGWAPKVYVRSNRSRSIYRRPVWRARWCCWCIRDEGWQAIMTSENDANRFRVMSMVESQAHENALACL